MTVKISPSPAHPRASAGYRAARTNPKRRSLFATKRYDRASAGQSPGGGGDEEPVKRVAASAHIPAGAVAPMPCLPELSKATATGDSLPSSPPATPPWWHAARPQSASSIASSVDSMNTIHIPEQPETATFTVRHGPKVGFAFTQDGAENSDGDHCHKASGAMSPALSPCPNQIIAAALVSTAGMTQSPVLPEQKKIHAKTKSPSGTKRDQKLRRGLSELTLKHMINEENKGQGDGGKRDAGVWTSPPSPLPTLSPFLPTRKKALAKTKSPTGTKRDQKLRRGLSKLTLNDMIEEEKEGDDDERKQTRRRRSLSPRRPGLRMSAFVRQSSTATATTANRDKMLAYKVGPILGQGAFGKVNVAWHRLTNEQVAIKTYTRAGLRSNPEMQKAVKSEVAAMKVGQGCRYCIRILETVDKGAAGFSIVMEMAERGSLAAVLRRVKEQTRSHNKRRMRGSGSGLGSGSGSTSGARVGPRIKVPPADMAGAFDQQHARRIFRQLMEAVAHMHRHKIVHRDIKVENILFGQDGNVRLADFGFATVAHTSRALKMQCGTVQYMAPEIFSPKCEGYGTAVDVWSCGVVLYMMMSGGAAVPYTITASTMPGLHAHLKKLGTAGIKRPSWMGEKQFPETALALNSSMLKFDPERRITSEQILDHPWVRAGLRDQQVTIATESTRSPSTLPISNCTPTRMAATRKVAPKISPKSPSSTAVQTARDTAMRTTLPSLTPCGGVSTPEPRVHEKPHDDRVIEAMEALGFTREVIEGSLERGACNIVTATHFLLTRQFEREVQEGEVGGPFV